MHVATNKQTMPRDPCLPLTTNRRMPRPLSRHAAAVGRVDEASIISGSHVFPLTFLNSLQKSQGKHQFAPKLDSITQSRSPQFSIPKHLPIRLPLGKSQVILSIHKLSSIRRAPAGTYFGLGVLAVRVQTRVDFRTRTTHESKAYHSANYLPTLLLARRLPGYIWPAT